MSRQNKAVKKAKLAAGFSAARKSGSKGPAKTQPKHGKKAERRSKWNRADRQEGTRVVAAPELATS